MSNGMRISNYQRPVELLDIANRGKTDPKVDNKEVNTFKEMFSKELANDRSVQFSKHASQRLFSRNIELSNEKLNDIADAIDKAQSKGSKETLILTDDAALVISVPKRLVVTAFDKENLRDGVVTSIDSAVII